MERKYICPCGLTCCDCMYYKAEMYDAAKVLRDIIIDNQYDKFLFGNSNQRFTELVNKHFEMNEEQYWDKLGKNLDTYKKMPEFMDVLNSIVELQCHSTCYENGGCSMAGNTKECSALKCIQSKGFEGCWECNHFKDCEHLEFLKIGYGDVINENLVIIREHGLDAIQSRGNKYYVWQRRQAD